MCACRYIKMYVCMYVRIHARPYFILLYFVFQKHRVLIPEEDIKKRQTRQSIAFFSHPDDQCMITCIDGSNKYEPITSLDYLNMRFSETY